MTPEQVLFEAVRSYVRAVYGAHIYPQILQLRLSDQNHLRLPVPPPLKEDAAQRPKHSVDFRSVNWFGTRYAFTASQATVVRLLWEAWENDTPEVGQETLLEGSGSESNKLSDLFRDHSAWGSFIVPGTSRGTFCFSDSSE
jgi:hypothetical protein